MNALTQLRLSSVDAVPSLDVASLIRMLPGLIGARRNRGLGHYITEK